MWAVWQMTKSAGENKDHRSRKWNVWEESFQNKTGSMERKWKKNKETQRDQMCQPSLLLPAADTSPFTTQFPSAIQTSSASSFVQSEILVWFSVSCLARRPSQGRELAWPPPVNHLWPASEPGLPLRQRPQADGWVVTPQTNYTSVFNPRFGLFEAQLANWTNAIIRIPHHCFIPLLSVHKGNFPASQWVHFLLLCFWIAITAEMSTSLSNPKISMK